MSSLAAAVAANKAALAVILACLEGDEEALADESHRPPCPYNPLANLSSQNFFIFIESSTLGTPSSSVTPPFSFLLGLLETLSSFLRLRFCGCINMFRSVVELGNWKDDEAVDELHPPGDRTEPEVDDPELSLS